MNGGPAHSSECCSFCPFTDRAGCSTIIDARYKYLEPWILNCLQLRLGVSEAADHKARPLVDHLACMEIDGAVLKGVVCTTGGDRYWFQWTWTDAFKPRNLTYGQCSKPDKCEDGYTQV